MNYYSVKTWDAELGEFTPQPGLTGLTFNITWGQLRVALRMLQSMGYSARRSDPSVLVERIEEDMSPQIGEHWVIADGTRVYVAGRWSNGNLIIELDESEMYSTDPNGKCRPDMNSLRDLVRVWVQPKKILVRLYSQRQGAGYRVVAENVASDMDESLWKLCGTAYVEEGKFADDKST